MENRNDPGQHTSEMFCRTNLRSNADRLPGSRYRINASATDCALALQPCITIGTTGWRMGAPPSQPLRLECPFYFGPTNCATTALTCCSRRCGSAMSR